MSSRSRLTRLLLEKLEDRCVPASFTVGNLVVERVGGDVKFNGGDKLTDAATAVFLDELTTSAKQSSPVQTIELPTTDVDKASGG